MEGALGDNVEKKPDQVMGEQKGKKPKHHRPALPEMNARRAAWIKELVRLEMLMNKMSEADARKKWDFYNTEGFHEMDRRFKNDVRVLTGKKPRHRRNGKTLMKFRKEMHDELLDKKISTKEELKDFLNPKAHFGLIEKRHAAFMDAYNKTQQAQQQRVPFEEKVPPVEKTPDQIVPAVQQNGAWYKKAGDGMKTMAAMIRQHTAPIPQPGPVDVATVEKKGSAVAALISDFIPLITNLISRDVEPTDSDKRRALTISIGMVDMAKKAFA